MYRGYLCACLCAQLAGVLRIVLSFQFSQVSDSVGLSGVSGRVGALADFNGDRLTDMLTLNEEGREFSLYLWNQEARVFDHQYITLDVPMPVVRVAVADFDVDGTVDIVSFSNTQSECCLATVHWCTGSRNGSYHATGNRTTLSNSVAAYPLILDYNSDHIPDIGWPTVDGGYTVWISQGKLRSFERRAVLNSNSYDRVRSSSFVDIDSDLVPDLVIFAESKDGLQLVMDTASSQCISCHLPNMAVLGVPVFVDIDGDGVMEIVLLSCYDIQCLHTAVNTIALKEANSVRLKKFPGTTPSVQFELKVSTLNLSSLSLTGVQELRLSVGDLNLDGYSDLLLTFASNRSLSSPLVLLGSSSKLWPLVIPIEPQPNATQTIFFDLFEDGVPDLLVVENQGVGSKTRITAYQQTLDQDNAFLKVLVLGGPCTAAYCEEQHPTAVPGATVRFSTTDRQGHKETGVSVPGGYGDSPLQLPFVLFGLGETPNFIESLSIGLAHRSGNMSTLTVAERQWTLMVPNSQIVVLTLPANDTQRWVGELYLSPSNLVYSTAGVLAATAVAMAIIIALLQAREKYLDSKEKQQAKHRFHFNAM